MSNARKILIIDDDDELRESLSEQLTLHEEFDTLLAATASEGLKLARYGHVDLVLLDVGLPDLDGREACKLLRRGGFKGADRHADRRRSPIPTPSWVSIPAPTIM